MAEPTNPNPNPESEPTRRAMMAQVAMAAAAAMVETNRAAAQGQPPGARRPDPPFPPEKIPQPPPGLDGADQPVAPVAARLGGGGHGAWKHFDKPPTPPRPAPQS